ncbi:MAG: HAMP domain-containing protein [Desulfatitalea sp.]|nr:HAMP domain-containing protein [Desulfatitalea sp.]NNK01926.1 HAMP domain-containing protein [Desulfatitalea sp.]
MQISIRKKVAMTLGAYILVASVLWLLIFLNSLTLNEKLRIIEKKEDLLNTILEARRYEKNFFLTFNNAHLGEAVSFISMAEGKLQDIITHHARYAATPDLERSLAHLKDYGVSMGMLASSQSKAPAPNAGPAPRQEAIRALGREITEEIETMVQNERQQINRLIRDARFYHFAALGGILILSILVFVFFLVNVNRPLKALERAIRHIAAGHYANIPAIPAGQEFESLVNSLNHMINRLNRRNQELIQARKMASLGTLTSGVAHELNNPLNNISTSVQIVLEELEDDDIDFKRELLQAAEKEVVRARDIVRALLEFSRQSPFSIKPVAVKSLVSDTLKLIKGELPSNVTVDVKIENDIQAALDFRRMQQVLLNMMLNGIQAMDQGGTLTISAFDLDDHTFCIEVSDTGCGIPDENLNKIFDPFFSTKEGRRKSENGMLPYDGILEPQGTGLGLAICHGIVQEHGGKIIVRSKVGEGTTFTIRLPIGRTHDH